MIERLRDVLKKHQLNALDKTSHPLKDLGEACFCYRIKVLENHLKKNPKCVITKEALMIYRFYLKAGVYASAAETDICVQQWKKYKKKYVSKNGCGTRGCCRASKGLIVNNIDINSVPEHARGLYPVHYNVKYVKIY